MTGSAKHLVSVIEIGDSYLNLFLNVNDLNEAVSVIEIGDSYLNKERVRQMHPFSCFSDRNRR